MRGVTGGQGESMGRETTLLCAKRPRTDGRRLHARPAHRFHLLFGSCMLTGEAPPVAQSGRTGYGAWISYCPDPAYSPPGRVGLRPQVFRVGLNR
jgi:hypothetical protein